MIRLNKFLASAGIASRRKCDDLILAGKVKVNGKIITQLGVRIEEDIDKVEFEGKPLFHKKESIYIILNKPKNVITTAKDQHDRNTVVDLIPIKDRIFPVGRLDYDSTGLLILTNDGDLSHSLIHPKFKIKKTYHVLLNRVLRPVDKYKFEHGIMLEGKKTIPCKVSEIRVVDNCSLLDIEITEGRNRQIRRMFEILGYKVEKLDRIAFANLSLTGLQRSEWRYLTQKEIDTLKREALNGS